MYEGQEAPVRSPAKHLSLKRPLSLLSITVSSSLFSIHIFCLETGGTPKGVLKIPPSFLCPSSLLKTCGLHSNGPCLHTELIQLVVMNMCACVCVWVCVCVFGGGLHSCSSLPVSWVSVRLGVCCFVLFLFSSKKGRSFSKTSVQHSIQTR